MTIQNLLDFIAKPESGGDYNIVYGGIKKADQPKKPLTTMTIGEVLAWQDSIDARYRSEAAGKYQIMEDTLRGLYTEADLNLSSVFDAFGQDTLAVVLLQRRGLRRYLAGTLSAEAFANNLAHEWASLPWVSGRRRGFSVYAGDGLNKAHVTPEALMAAVLAVKRPATAPHSASVASPAQGFWARLWAALNPKK